MSTSADSFIPEIRKEIDAIKKTDSDKGQLCGEAVRHAIECGDLLNLAFENVRAENGKWGSWLLANFGEDMPVSTAALYRRLATNREFLFERMAQIGGKQMSLRTAASLLPLTDDGKKKRAKAQEKAAKRKEEEQLEKYNEVKASIPPEEVVGSLAVDEIFEMLTDKFDKDQLSKLSGLLTEYLSDEEEQKTVAEEELMRRIESQVKPVERRI